MNTEGTVGLKPVFSRPRRVRGREQRAEAEIGPAPWGVVLIALGIGLVAGLMELLGLLVWRHVGGVEARLGNHLLHRHFLWMTPAASLLVSVAVGAAFSLVCRLWPRSGWRAACFAFGMLWPLTLLLAIRPLYPAASVLLAAGIARWLGPILDERFRRARRLPWRSVLALSLVWVGLVGFAFGRDLLREQRALRALPAARPGTPNVLLIVLDTVRADALSPYGARRDTTPALARLARAGVRFENARSTAPWTLPSHASLFTGRWPCELSIGLTKPLDATFPTLAESLARRGYATGGFVANFVFASPEYGLDRGFIHYDDRPDTVKDMLSCSGIGRRLVPALDLACWGWSRLVRGVPWYDPVDPAFVAHRRGAAEVRRSFVNWAAQARREGRPFFAFLNMLDAHNPYLPADQNHATHFGRHVTSWADFVTMRDWGVERERDNRTQDRARHVTADAFALARDSYDDCLAAADTQVGRLLHDLDRMGVLRDTLVVVTSDHGESFGEHGFYLHGVTLFRPELDVPLLLAWPGHLPEGKVVAAPASLHDLPATITDLAGCGDGAPFPGRSLARHWREAVATDDPLLSELPEYGSRAVQLGSKVYIRYSDGNEHLFDHATDPGESRSLAHDPASLPDLEHLRRLLAQFPAAERH